MNDTATTRLPDSCHENILANLPGATDSDRLLVVLLQQFGSGTRLELRQQTWAAGLGWFTQSSLPISREQLAGLRAALGTAQIPARRSANRGVADVAVAGWHAESA